MLQHFITHNHSTRVQLFTIQQWPIDSQAFPWPRPSLPCHKLKFLKYQRRIQNTVQVLGEVGCLKIQEQNARTRKWCKLLPLIRIHSDAVAAREIHQPQGVIQLIGLHHRCVYRGPYHRQLPLIIHCSSLFKSFLQNMVTLKGWVESYWV